MIHITVTINNCSAIPKHSLSITKDHFQLQAHPVVRDSAYNMRQIRDNCYNSCRSCMTMKADDVSDVDPCHTTQCTKSAHNTMRYDTVYLCMLRH